MMGRSPPSSTVLRMSVEAMPVSMRTRPNQAPQHTLTKVVPQFSGADWKILFKTLITVVSVPSPNCKMAFASMKEAEEMKVPPIDSTVHITEMIRNPIIRL